MKRKLYGSLTVAVIAILALGMVAAGEGTWISAGGQTIELEGDGNNVFFSDDDGFDLSDLADGETRIFGSGDKQVTVSRRGDEATIERPASADKAEVSVTCRLSSDTCKVITSDDSDEVVVMIQKRRECVGGEVDCGQLVIDDLAGAVGHTIAITKIVECDGGGECIETEVSEGMPHGHHGIVHIDGAVQLRCPEGDTRMQVDADEADQVFLCPKHSKPLEKVEPRRHRVHKIHVRGQETPHQH